MVTLIQFYFLIYKLEMLNNDNYEFSKKKNFFDPKKKTIDVFINTIEKRLEKYYNKFCIDKIKKSNIKSPL